MFRSFAMTLILAASVTLVAQQANQPMRSTTTSQTGSPSVVVVPSNPAVVVIGGGPYGSYLTPLSTLPMQETGITLGARAGISLQAPIQQGIITAVPTPYTWGAPMYSPAWMAANPNTYAAGEAETGRMVNDLGPSYYVGALPSTTGPSLGEFARAYKQSHPHAVRIFTNADAERLSNTVTIPTTPSQPQQNQPPKQPQQKENMPLEHKPQMPRSTASVGAPADVPAQ
jgi:hypothetical protein